MIQTWQLWTGFSSGSGSAGLRAGLHAYVCKEHRTGPCLSPVTFQLGLHNTTLCNIAVHTRDKMTCLILRYTKKCYSLVVAIQGNAPNVSYSLRSTSNHPFCKQDLNT